MTTQRALAALALVFVVEPARPQLIIIFIFGCLPCRSIRYQRRIPTTVPTRASSC
jgi:hypothetical protein